jgi:dipeptidyl aminopeptidase/acylaminoacyl peptidase
MSCRPVAVLVLLSTLPGAAGAAQPAPGVLPLEDFFRNPAFYDVQISRDGRYLSAITHTEDLPTARNIVVMEVGKWNESRLVTAYQEEEIRWHDWVDGGRLVFMVDRAYEDPGKSSEYVGFYSVRHDGKKGRMLHEPFRRDSRRGRGTSAGNMAANSGGLRENLSMISDLPNDPEHILVAVNGNSVVFPDVFRMRLKNGSLEPAGRANQDIRRWFADHEGQVRVALGQGEVRDDLNRTLLYRETEKDDWQTILSFYGNDLTPHAFDGDNRHLWLSARLDRDTSALYRLDLTTGELGAPVLADPVFDVNDYGRYTRGLVVDRDGRALSYEYMADRPRQFNLDDRWARHQQTVDGALPGRFNQIVDWSDDRNRLVVKSSSDREPGRYYLLDLEAASLRFVVAERPWIDEEKMAAMTPVSFEARDGMTVHAYLTLPTGHAVDGCEQTCGLPLIVHPHGGPYGVRDDWSYNPDVQFLASRGYAVLQVNYRGSGGYGGHFETAGYKRWGLEMQDDLTDAVGWAIERGYADPDRVAIYGASYGGYATMMGLVKTPDLYRAGINYVGVVDLVALYRQGARRDRGRVAGWNGFVEHYWRDRIGDPGTDKERFHDTSPLNFVDQIEAPVLVVHGRLDYNVESDYQYQPLVRALKKHDKVHETLYKRHEGHGFYREQNQIELYEKIEGFLARYMPAEEGTPARVADR